MSSTFRDQNMEQEHTQLGAPVDASVGSAILGWSDQDGAGFGAPTRFQMDTVARLSFSRLKTRTVAGRMVRMRSTELAYMPDDGS